MKNNFKSHAKKILVTVLTVAMVLTTSIVPSFAATNQGAETPYDSFVILGDSLCLGFAAAENNGGFNIINNATILQEEGQVYGHSYPSVFARRIGLKPGESFYNFGIAALWSGDMLELLTNPNYKYEYDEGVVPRYDETTTFILPEDYVGQRMVVLNKESAEYDIADPSTWVQDWNDWENYEEYTVPAGTEIRVMYNMDMGYGMVYPVVNEIITNKYNYVSENCVKDGELVGDPIYYPMRYVEDEWYSYWDVDRAKAAELGLGEPVYNPEFYLVTPNARDYVIEKTKNADLITLAIGGNDIYHSFMNYQMESGTALGDMIAMITSSMMNGMSIADILPMLAMIVADPSMAEMMGIDVENMFSEEELAKLLKHYSKDSINDAFEGVISDYEKNLDGLIRTIKEINPDAQLTIFGHYNPFGIVNFFAMLAQELQDGTLDDDLGGKIETVTNLVDFLKAFVGTDPSVYEDILADPAILESMQGMLMGETTDLLGALTSGKVTSEEFSELLNGLSFPLAVLSIGTGLSDVYDQFNEIAQRKAAEYGLPFTDVANAPANGKFDPHPNTAGHKWLAEKLYETVMPTITASVCKAGSGNGYIDPEGATAYRLGSDVTYKFTPTKNSKIAAIYVDGKLLPCCHPAYCLGEYTFKDVQSKHTISVQYDKINDVTYKYNLDVLGSYAPLKSGAGLYEPGERVKVSAGELPGYEFAGWYANGITLADPMNPNQAFLMPYNDITLVATWKPAADEENPQPQINTLTFNTNGGTKINDLVLEEGSIVNVDGFVPEKDGLEFVGWYLDPGFNVKISGDFVLHTNTTLYAKWMDKENIGKESTIWVSYFSPFAGEGSGTDAFFTKVPYGDDKEIRFVADNGSIISAIWVDGKYLDPKDPENAKVYTNGSYVFEDVTSDHRIVVYFEKSLDPTPRFNVEVLGTYAPIQAGEGLYKPGYEVTINAGQLDGYVFAGWEVFGFAELADPTSPVTTFKMPYGPVTVVAKWTPVYNLYFESNGGSDIHYISAPKGEEISLADYVPTKEGYNFVGWFYDKELTQKVDMYTFAGNAVVYAKWEPIPDTGDTANPTVWLAIMGVLLAALGTALALKKKED